MLWTPTPTGLSLFDMLSQGQTTITKAEVRDVFWAPDSTSFIYVAQNQIHRFYIATSVSTQVDTNLGGQKSSVSCTWIEVP
jgi:hypothetical protein